MAAAPMTTKTGFGGRRNIRQYNEFSPAPDKGGIGMGI